LLFLKAVEDQFNSCRYPEFVKDAEQVISDDQLRDRGWPVSGVVLSLYTVTAVFAAIGLYGVRTQSPLFWLSAMVAIGLFLGAAVRLGSLRYDPTERAVDNSEAAQQKTGNEEIVTAPPYGR
jgi:hypothetical protein